MSDTPGNNSGNATPSGGPRTLGGQAVDTSLPADWGKKEKKFGRVGDWGSSGGSGSGARGSSMPGGFGGAGADDDDDDDDDEGDARRGEKELYTGGEKRWVYVICVEGCG